MAQYVTDCANNLWRTTCLKTADILGRIFKIFFAKSDVFFSKIESMFSLHSGFLWQTHEGCGVGRAREEKRWGSAKWQRHQCGGGERSLAFLLCSAASVAPALTATMILCGELSAAHFLAISRCKTVCYRAYCVCILSVVLLNSLKELNTDFFLKLLPFFLALWYWLSVWLCSFGPFMWF